MFKIFKERVAEQFEKMKEMTLFETEVDKDLMWETYLQSFPDGSNPMFKERTEHDCQSCKQFIRTAGNIVAIDGQMNLHTIWDIKIDGPYQTVANTMSMLVTTRPISNVLFRTQKKMGIDHTLAIADDQSVTTWEHFYFELPSRCVKQATAIGEHSSMTRSSYDVLARGLKEITPYAIETVTDLINQNALYRGEENKFIVTEFFAMKNYYSSLKESWKKANYTWYASVNSPSGAVRIRNTSIGQLLQDLSAEMDINTAVYRFEKMVAPINYKRTTALITKNMIAKAQTDCQELGYTSSLNRRFAVIEDVSINDVLFANRRAKRQMNAFEQLADSIPETGSPNLDKVQEMGIETFVDTVLPTATVMEVFVENKHQANLMSLIAPVNADAKNLFKWNNGFSWAYKGDVTDSIKERVKAAGGDVTGYLRCSLAWFNSDDLDIHLHCPNGSLIYFGDKHPAGIKGELDVDMNAGGINSTNPVENITFRNESDIPEGEYSLRVNNFNKRSNENVGFVLEMAVGNDIRTYEHKEAVGNHKTIEVAKFSYSKTTGVTIIKALEQGEHPKTAWGISTQKFHNVSLMTLSPNHWRDSGTGTGNRHYFFILQDCKNDTPARGFFNEFLSNDLIKHKKVFEMLGSKMKAQPTDRQLSGLGFSSTIPNSILCRVTGRFTQMIKITF